MKDPWRHSAQWWTHLTPPLRPGPEDLQVIIDWMHDPELRLRAPRVLALGATPEFHALPWPPDVQLTAVDLSTPMLRGLWPGDTRVCADWLFLPFADGAIDLALCDGGLAQLSLPRQQALVAALARALRPGGLAILRCLTPPPARETVTAVLEEVRSGRLANCSFARLRLWMALQKSAEEGVSNQACWRQLLGMEPRLERLAELLNTDAGYIRYAANRDEDRIYRFLDTEAVHRMFTEEPGGFRLEAMHIPPHRFGAWTPTHVLRRI